MRVTFVRHTRTVAPEGVCYGRTDLDLSDAGRLHVQALADNLPVDSTPYILSSPAMRCRALAEALAERLHVPIQYDARLWELDFGGWEMVPWNDIPVTELNPWMEDYVHQRAGGGETFLELIERSHAALAEHQELGTAQLLCVAHSGVIRGLLAKYEGQPYDSAFRRPCDYGSVHATTLPSLNTRSRNA